MSYVRPLLWSSLFCVAHYNYEELFYPLAFWVNLMNHVSEILDALDRGDPLAADRLLPVVYDDLRRLAASKLAKEAPGQTLQATALVHEAYLRLVGSKNDSKWEHRGHFFMAAAEAMRRILINRARDKKALKRGGGAKRVEMQEADLVVSIPDSQLLALDDALNDFAEDNPKEAELVKLRYFAGLTLEQSAEALGISSATAYRYWAFARAYLQEELASEDTND